MWVTRKLNADLFRIRECLNNRRLTINTKKSQFMVIGSLQWIKVFDDKCLGAD